MLAWLIIAAFAILPQTAVLHDRVAVVERNNFYDDCGRLVFTQMVFWGADSRVREWRMDKGEFAVRRDYDSREWLIRWIDKDGPLREVRALTFDESWTQFDVEVADRELLPVTERRPLSRGK